MHIFWGLVLLVPGVGAMLLAGVVCGMFGVQVERYRTPYEQARHRVERYLWTAGYLAFFGQAIIVVGLRVLWFR